MAWRPLSQTGCADSVESEIRPQREDTNLFRSGSLNETPGPGRADDDGYRAAAFSARPRRGWPAVWASAFVRFGAGYGLLWQDTVYRAVLAPSLAR